MSRDKKAGDEKLEDMLKHIQGEEERNKTLNRNKLKLEAAMQELQSKLDRESKVRIFPRFVLFRSDPPANASHELY